MFYKSLRCQCGREHAIFDTDGLNQELFKANGDIMRMRQLLLNLQQMVYPLGDAFNLIEKELYGEIT